MNNNAGIIIIIITIAANLFIRCHPIIGLFCIIASSDCVLVMLVADLLTYSLRSRIIQAPKYYRDFFLAKPKTHCRLARYHSSTQQCGATAMVIMRARPL
jgi:hypothetical protein